MSEPAAAPCPTCGAAIDGRFCAACGEQRVAARDYSVSRFVAHVFESLTNFDFKSLRAVKTLVTQPGRLTRDYLDGRRRSYIGPVQLFVIVNVVFAVWAPTTLRTPLSVQMTNGPFVELKRSLVASAMTGRALDREDFRRSFDDSAGLQAKTWVFAMIPLLAVVTAAVYGFRRYFFEHLIFATHVLAFTLAWLLVINKGLTAGLLLSGQRLSVPDLDTLSSSFTLAGLAVYFFAALRRAFGDRTITAAARALALTALFFPIVFVYRFLLFFVTLETMH
jgi:hypothetical protein